MAQNLVIVESPHKARQIQGFLGSEYSVVSSKGHIRDLEEKGMSIDIENNFAPKYIISPDKKALVATLKKMAAEASVVWLASDPDREGEAIAWHLSETLGLDPAKSRRVTYNEVTPAAVLDAFKRARAIDMNLVDAQQARRVLDRLVGFELSPVLWRKIRRGLSAGRVQSVTLRLVVDREREIAAFTPEAYYSVAGKFVISGGNANGTLDTRFSSLEDARKFLEACIGASFSVDSVDSKEATRTPAPPFTTSTLQQEASRRLHFSSSRTMRIAQSLYEQGLITYMRTDSTNLSGLAINTAKQYVVDNFGEEYSQPRNYKTHSKGAQEAHEAIRPTFIANTQVKGTPEEQKLYELIWKRTVASQMSEAKVLNTSVKLAVSTRDEKFIIQSMQILFDGFMKLYRDDDDDRQDASGQLLPEIKPGDTALAKSIGAECRFTQAPQRYTEQALIKKMEEIGIGRPSTYAPTITTLTSTRGYIVVADREGVATPVVNLLLEGDRIKESRKTEMVGSDKRKFIPTDVGLMVTDYLKENFTDIMDYDFTANVEKGLDNVAEGEREWTDLIRDFYKPFHRKVDAAIADRQFKRIERELGVDPSDGKVLVAKYGQFGPYVQKGDGEDRVFVSLDKGQNIETLTLEEALRLFSFPRNLGKWNDVDVVVLKGRYGPYLKYGDRNVSLPRGKNPMSVTLDEAVALLDAPEKEPVNRVILEFKDSDISVINGRYGPYLKHAGANYKLPKGTDAEKLSEQDCLKIIQDGEPTARRKSSFRRRK